MPAVRDLISAENCSVKRALDVVGEKWTLLVLREAFYGARRFERFQAGIGCPRQVLTDRLNTLVAADVLRKVPYQEPGQRERHEYRLTEKGRDLGMVLTALRLWGDKWIYGEGKEPMLVHERESGAVVRTLVPADAEGHALDPKRLVVRAGPGITPELVARYTKPRARKSARAERNDA